MRLYHFTTQGSKWDMTKGIGKSCPDLSSLNPGHGSEMCYSQIPRAVKENWWEFFNDPKRKWMCTHETIPCMADIQLWHKSGELGRLIFYIKERCGNGIFDGETRLALASFETSPRDKIWVCEADWLKKYHEGKMNTLEAHIGFAESRVPLREYHDQFVLPEYRVGNPIKIERIEWKRVPKYAKPKRFYTRENIVHRAISLEF